MVHRRDPRTLVVCAWRALHPDDIAVAARHCRHAVAPHGGQSHTAKTAGKSRRRDYLSRTAAGRTAGEAREDGRMTAASTSALLYLNAITVSFNAFRPLNGLSLPIHPGEMRAI